MNDPAPGGDRVPNIFISYRRADSSGHAGWLNASLKEHFGGRVRIFMDFDAIGYGEDFVEVIRRAVESSLALIVVIGRQWASATDPQTGRRRLDDPDDIVRFEVATALKRNTRVIPVLVEGATMPAAGELPPDLTALSRRNAIEISDARFDFDVKRLTDTLERVIPPTSPPKLPPPAREERRRFGGLTPKTLITAGAVVAALAVLALASFAAWRYTGGGAETHVNDNRAPATNSGDPAVNNSVNDPVNTGRPNVNGGGAATVNSPTPAPPEPVRLGRDGVQVVRLVSGRAKAHGFFTPEGYIVTLAGAVTGEDTVVVSWRHGEREIRQNARVVKRGGSMWDAAFLKLEGGGLLRHPTPVRLSASLKVDEPVERYLGPADRTPGRVVKLRSDQTGGIPGGMLVTTKMSAGGDAGAPLIDAQGRIVAMVVGGSVTETLSIPVEALRLNFFEAF